jgi:NurA-like 5'-3' nuclease
MSAMAMPALLLEEESDVDERTIRLEANVEHMRTDIADMKVDIRKLNEKLDSVDKKLTDKIDGGDSKLTDKIDAVDRKLTDKIDAVDRKLTDKIDAVDRKLTDKIDAVEKKLTDKIDAVEKKLTDKIDAVKDSVAALALSMEKSFSAFRVGRALDRVWWLVMSGGILGIMARAFKWI